MEDEQKTGIRGGDDAASSETSNEELELARFSLDHAAIAAFLVSSDGRFLYVNEQGCRALGYSREELLSLTVSEVDPDFPPSRWLEHWAELKRRKALHFETRHRRKDGRIFPVEISVNYLEFGGREYNWAFARDISERRAAEEKLKRAYQLTRTILDSMNDSVSLIDVQDLRIQGVNKIFLQDYGFTSEKEVTGRFCFEVTHHRSDVCIPPDDVCPLAETLRTGEHFEVEHVHYGSRGEKIYVEISTSPIKDESGRVVQVVHVARNITARKQAENDLRRSEQRFRDIAELAEEWIWEVDTEGRYTYASPVVRKILGYGPEEVVGRYFHEFFHPRIREEQTRKALEKFARREPFRNFENLNMDRLGRTIILSTTGMPLFNEEGSFLGYRGVDRDITLGKQAEEELRISESRFRNLFGQSSLSMQIFAPDGQSLEVNRAWERLWRLRAEEVRNYNILEDPQLIAKGVAPYIRKGFAGEAVEIPAVRYDPGEIGLNGQPRWVKAFIYPVLGEGNQIRQVVLMHLDISEQVRAEEAVRESEKRLAMAQQAGGVGVFDWDLISDEVIWTEQMEHIFGLRPGAFEGNSESWLRRMHPEDRPLLESRMRQWFEERVEQAEFELRFIRSDGRIRWLSAGLRLGYLADSTPARVLGAGVDITERKEMEETIRHQAYHDTLTGLPNRRLFSDLLALETARARRNHEKVAVLFLDLDRFKGVNDTLGHAIGDELLRGVANRLKHHLRESDSVARIGGDEFNILLSGITRIEDVVSIAAKISGSFRAPYVIDGHSLQAAASIGISIYPDDASDPELLLGYADAAMYQAKEQGGNGYRFHGRHEPLLA